MFHVKMLNSQTGGGNKNSYPPYHIFIRYGSGCPVKVTHLGLTNACPGGFRRRKRLEGNMAMPNVEWQMRNDGFWAKFKAANGERFKLNSTGYAAGHGVNTSIDTFRKICFFKVQRLWRCMCRYDTGLHGDSFGGENFGA